MLQDIVSGLASQLSKRCRCDIETLKIVVRTHEDSLTKERRKFRKQPTGKIIWKLLISSKPAYIICCIYPLQTNEDEELSAGFTT